MKSSDATFYVVLRRGRWGTARVIRKSQHKPRLGAGECAVRVSLSVPDEAFEPVLASPTIAVPVGDVLRAPVAGKAGS